MLTVYVAGLVYFNGCEQPVKRMFAPDGTDGEPAHFASLWIDPGMVDEGATQWWEGFRETRTIGGVPMVEFRIPEPSEIVFPDLGNGGTCDDLDNKLSKLKKKKKDGTEEPFVVDPDAAETIAEVTIRGGSLTPRRYKNMGLVVWSIPAPPSLQITATWQDNASESRTITVKPSAEGATPEVVFANTHDLSVPEPKDAPDDDHDLALFLKLNPALGDAILVSKKPPGSAGHIFTGNTVVDRLRDIKYSGGDPPDCCDN